MNRLLLVLGALAASALLVPGDAAAQRFGGRGGGGARIGGFGGYRTAAIARPGLGSVVRPGAIYRPGFGRYGVRAPYYGRVAGAYRPYYRGYYGTGWRYPYYGGYYRGYPYYGGALVAGLTLGALSGPYYGDYGYEDGYPYESGVYAGPVEGQTCWQGPPWCTAAGYPNVGYIRRQQGAPF